MFSQNEENIMKLLHSALDLHQPLYDFVSWLNSPELLNPGQQMFNNSEVSGSGDHVFLMKYPLAFENYNEKGMGIGLKA